MTTPCRVSRISSSQDIGVKPRPLWLPATGPVCGGPGLPRRQFQKWNAYSLATISWQLTPQTYLVTFHLVSSELISALISTHRILSTLISFHGTTKGPKSKVSAMAWIRLRWPMTLELLQMAGAGFWECWWLTKEQNDILMMLHSWFTHEKNGGSFHSFPIKNGDFP